VQIRHRVQDAFFRAVHGHRLIYNTCWEDPRADRELMRLDERSRIVMITSAGCNALDYALEGPARVIAVDANPRQTALLELKLAAIRRLEYADSWALFGLGWHAGFAALYRERLRGELSDFARAFWDARLHWFADARANLYTRGLTGLVSRLFRGRLDPARPLGRLVRALFEQPDLESQRRLYLEQVRAHFWTPTVRWFLSTHMFLSLVGVPTPQRRLLMAQHPAGIAASIQSMIDELFCTVPARDNYFWGVYVFGGYQPARCPRYLTPEGYARLKAGLVDRIEAHTCTVTEYLERPGEPLTRAVLLDHMDWMSSYYPQALHEEWQALHARLAPGARMLFRSAHVAPPFLDTLHVGAARTPVRAWLQFRPEEAQALARADRVHTYPGFHIADVPA
jgi:S-adenosylmethionine-diacylglycerol 3-amino-3-carboxypropyl transferase